MDPGEMDAMSAPGAGTKGIGGSRQLPCPASRSPLTCHTLLGLTCLNGPQKTSELFVCNKMVNTLKVKRPETYGSCPIYLEVVQST